MLVGVLLGLAFVEKMAAVFVLVAAPALAGRRHGCRRRLAVPERRVDWIDGLLTSAAMLPRWSWPSGDLTPAAATAPARQTDLFVDRPPSDLPGGILAVPLAVWVVRRLLGRVFPAQPALGRRAARPGDLDGHPRVRTGRRLAGQSRPGGARPCPGWRITTCSSSNRRVLFPTSRSSTSARPTSTACPGTMPGCCWGSRCPRRSCWRRRSASSGALGRFAATGCRSTSWSIS